MAQKVFTDLNINQNELQNAVIQNLASAPINPVSGQHYFNTNNSKEYVYDGTEWVSIVDGGGSSLPDMTGNAHKLLSNDGTDAFWMAKDYYRSLTSAQATTLLSDGTYNGENVTDGSIFVCDDGSIKEYNVEYSNPSLTWELTTKPYTYDYRQSACYNPDTDEIVVYNFYSSTSTIYKSSDKGQTWTLMHTFSGTIDSNSGVNQIFYCNGYYILLRWGYGIYYSTDLTNWTDVSSSAFSGVYNSNEMKLTYFNGTYFFTYGSNANSITSTDLTNWTNTSGSHYSLAVGNGVITDGWKISTDGTTWTSTTSNTSGLIWLIYVPNYNNGSFIGFKRNSSTIYVSNDNFETVSTITPTGLSSFNTNSLIAYNNGLFIVSKDSIVYYSTDLTNWTSSTTADNATRLNALFADNDGYWYYSKWSSTGASDNFHKGTYSITVNRSLEQLSYKIDNNSITQNSSDELQTVGVIDQNATTTAIKTWTGTLAQYNALVSGGTVDSNTLYNITDDSDTTLTLLQTIYPVGAIYIGTMETCPLASLFGTWTLVSSGRVLQGSDANHSAGSTIEAGLPNITGSYGNDYTRNNYMSTKTGAIYGVDKESTYYISATANTSTTNDNGFYFDASRSSAIYGNSNTVQPPAFVVNIWQRTA